MFLATLLSIFTVTHVRAWFLVAFPKRLPLVCKTGQGCSIWLRGKVLEETPGAVWGALPASPGVGMPGWGETTWDHTDREGGAASLAEPSLLFWYASFPSD